MEEKQTVGKIILSVVIGIISILWIYPVFMILINALKVERAISTTFSSFRQKKHLTEFKTLLQHLLRRVLHRHLDTA